MNSTELILPFAGGLLLSGLYFSALWFTVKRLPQSLSPYGLMGVSFLLRTAGLLGGFFLLAQGRWQRLVACVAGFVIVRTLFVARMKTSLLRHSSAQGS